MKDLIRRLVEVPGPSGFENQIREIVLSEIETLVDEVRVDNLGNLIARKGNQNPKGIRIMLAAHLDEIGIMVTHVDEHGFVRFTPLGGVMAQFCLGARVRFLNGDLGVINRETRSETGKSKTFEELFIDLGSESFKDSSVSVGDVGVFEGSWLEVGNRIISKALDDRIGAAVLVETLRRISKQNISLPGELYYVFSVQEEVGLRGANTAAFSVEPDLGIAVDVTRTGDTPKGIKMEVRLGEGPAIKVRDRGMISDPRLVSWMTETARQAGLPFQLEVLERGTTDARAIQISRTGVPSGCISIPCRYIHTPSEMVDYSDVLNAAALLIELIQKPADIDLNSFKNEI